MKNKTIKFICAAILATVILFSLTACNPYKKYTVDDHLEKISKSVQKWYIDSDEIGDYTGFTITKLYDDNDEFSCFLVELEPQGFFYVGINKDYKEIGKHIIAVNSINPVMHNGDVANPWQRYRLSIDGIAPEPYEGIIWQKDDTVYYSGEDRRWEVDKDGNFVEHIDSPFKVAGIGDEKRYLLKKYTYNYKGEYFQDFDYTIPAVKRGERFLNLISMEEFEYEREFDEKTIPYYTFDNWKHWRSV